MIPSQALKSLLLAVAAGSIVVLAGCGKKTASTAPTSAPAATTAPAATPTPSREIVIHAGDQMKFDTTEFTVAPGETVKLTLQNTGTMPKFSMGHNLVILRHGASVEDFAEKASTAAATDYVPTDAKVIAHTALVGGGESSSVVFTAPQIRTQYPFLCTFPGHMQVGMKGVMRVE